MFGLRLSYPLLSPSFYLPTAKQVDLPLIFGGRSICL